jgi:signal transduction histidine kinase
MQPLDPPTVHASQDDRLDQALVAVRQRLGLLRWLVPVGMFLLVVVYEIGPARWTLARLGPTPHIAIDLTLYGVLGPTLAAVLLDLLGRWIEERETTAAQSLALAQARERAQLQHDLTDDTLQTLFAASAMLAALEGHAADLPANALTHIQTTHAALETAIQKQYASLKK